MERTNPQKADQKSNDWEMGALSYPSFCIKPFMRRNKMYESFINVKTIPRIVISEERLEKIQNIFLKS